MSKARKATTPRKSTKKKKRGKYTRRKIKSYTNERARQAGKQKKNPEEKKQAERKATQKDANSRYERNTVDNASHYMCGTEAKQEVD